MSKKNSVIKVSRQLVEELDPLLVTTFDRLKRNETVYVDQIPRTKRALRKLGHTEVQIKNLEMALKTTFPNK